MLSHGAKLPVNQAISEVIVVDVISLKSTKMIDDMHPSTACFFAPIVSGRSHSDSEMDISMSLESLSCGARSEWLKDYGGHYKVQGSSV